MIRRSGTLNETGGNQKFPKKNPSNSDKKEHKFPKDDQIPDKTPLAYKQWMEYKGKS